MTPRSRAPFALARRASSDLRDARGGSRPAAALARRLQCGELRGREVGTDFVADVFEQDGVFCVEVALPGVKIEEVSVMAQGSRLVISARRAEQHGVCQHPQRGRRVPRSFAHDVTLPREARLDLASASYEQGLLRVCIPLDTDDAKPGRPIPVQDLGARSDETRGGSKHELPGGVGGSPAGAGAGNGGPALVPGSGFLPPPHIAPPRRCAWCGKPLDAHSAAGPLPPPACVRYGLCPACPPGWQRASES